MDFRNNVTCLSIDPISTNYKTIYMWVRSAGSDTSWNQFVLAGSFELIVTPSSIDVYNWTGVSGNIIEKIGSNHNTKWSLIEIYRENTNFTIFINGKRRTDWISSRFGSDPFTISLIGNHSHEGNRYVNTYNGLVSEFAIIDGKYHIGDYIPPKNISFSDIAGDNKGVAEYMEDYYSIMKK